MKFKIIDGEWKNVILLDPPSRTLTLEDGSVWHISSSRNEILELDIFMTRFIEKYAPWDLEGEKTLALTRGQTEFPEYEIQCEESDELNFEMFYFHKFTFDAAEFLKFPEHLKQGLCVEVISSAVRYFLADTLFFDFLLSSPTNRENVNEIFKNMTAMKKLWSAERRSKKP